MLHLIGALLQCVEYNSVFCEESVLRTLEAVRKADVHLDAHPWPHISASAKSLVLKMMCKDPAARPSASELVGKRHNSDATPNKADCMGQLLRQG